MRRISAMVVSALLLVGAAVMAPVWSSGAAAAPAPPSLGPNVYVFNPSMPQSQIQATVNAIAAQQVNNQFGTQRYALLFEPGTYGSATQPLNFQVGYYTEVAGLGLSPSDTVINGSVDVYNQCASPNNCVALNNFWRSLSNLTINVTTPNAGCYSGEFWAVSQAAPMRRVQINGPTTLMDYCTAPSYASGGFIADSVFTGGSVINGSQQQFFVRNSTIDHWTNGVWNQVFSGDIGAPPQCFPAQPSCGGPYTTLATSPVTEEEPFLYTDSSGALNVFVPAVQHNSVGPSWTNGSEAGRSIPLSRFFVANSTTPVASINLALAEGKDLLLTPGVYQLDETIHVDYANTVVLGLGFPTLVPSHGIISMQVADVPGVKLSGMIFDAGPVNSPALLEVGRCTASACSALFQPNNPTLLQDVFFRIGGATPGRATDSLVVNSSDVILDDVWAWRADHGNGVGWNLNKADTGVVVNGSNVTAYGLFVEHYQKTEIVWNGQNGEVIFLQNEMPYDPPSQAAWMAAPGVDGYPALEVTPGVTRFQGYGMGSYSNFDLGVPIYAERAFQVPDTIPAGSLHDLLTVFLNGSGGILHVVNNTGGSATAANPDTPVTVVSYP
ncbi:MAG TPA: glycosyl hydrolase family 28-related protein [Acidimicrobiales bacterium]|nr:glycosyl hydrolase family 28-related protein [Acidimicrobiales bacterium]